MWSPCDGNVLACGRNVDSMLSPVIVHVGRGIQLGEALYIYVCDDVTVTM